MSSQRTRTAALQRLALFLATGLSATVSGHRVAQPSELSGYLTLATDSRSHGLSQLYDGRASVQFGIDYELASNLFTGAIVQNVNYAPQLPFPKPREVLINLYAGYFWERADWDGTVSVSHYGYPDTTFDYDYSELAGLVTFRQRYFYRVIYTNNLLSFAGRATNQEIGIRWPLPQLTELSASLGYFDGRDDAYTHYNVGVSRPIGPVTLDLRYYGTNREIVNYLGSAAGDRWLLSLSYAIRRQR